MCGAQNNFVPLLKWNACLRRGRSRRVLAFAHLSHIHRMKTSTAKNALALRRHPAQARSRLTSAAIQEAFLRVLMERGYQQVRIREVALVAGVGIGTFYAYFSGKDALAALCIYVRFKSHALAMRQAIEMRRGALLQSLVDTLIDLLIDRHCEQPEQWSALAYLERLISSPEAYQKSYLNMVNVWSDALTSTADWPSEANVQDIAYVVHTTTYSLLYQTLMRAPKQIREPALRQQVKTAVHGYLKAVVPSAYRRVRRKTRAQT